MHSQLITRTTGQGPTAHRRNLSMEEIHADILGRYHREETDRNDTLQLSFVASCDSPTPEQSEEKMESILSETPNTVADECSLAYRDSRESSKSEENISSGSRCRKETAQFYYALGEHPPSVESDLQYIIEDDDDDNSSDEESKSVEILVDNSDEESEPEACFQGNLNLPISGSYKLSFRPLPNEVRPHSFVYHGIESNPPEITHRGIARGNYAQLHRKAWLEVSDPHHRYGKNLRRYYKYWEALNFPAENFFDWLDCRGTCAGYSKPELAECPRAVLDTDTVLYIKNSAISAQYALTVHANRKTGRASIVDATGRSISTGPEGWIFVLRDNVLYGAQKITSVSGRWKQRFHHSTFFGGKAVAAAGIIITDDNGILTQFFPHSGHYRPGEADMQRMLFFLHGKGVDLRLIQVDIQQLIHVSRKDANNNEADGVKKKKLDSMHLKPAIEVAHQLSHKARFIAEGVFADIHLTYSDDAEDLFLY